MSNYAENVVADIVLNYDLLKTSLAALEDIRNDKHGAVLGYAAVHYDEAEKALQFLNSEDILSTALREKLKIGELEEKLADFRNTHIRL